MNIQGDCADCVVILEDHPLVAKITQEVVLACAPSLQVQLFGSLATLAAAGLSPRAVLTDLMLPDAEGLEVIAKIREIFPDVPILVCTAVDSQDTLDALSAAGLPWVHKRSPSHEMFANVIGWLQTAGLIDKDTDILQKLSNRNSYQSQIIAPGGDKPLTLKQVQIMECSSKGLSAKETARVLGLSLDTVRAHMTEIFLRLGAKNVAQAMDIYNRAKRDAELRSVDMNQTTQ